MGQRDPGTQSCPLGPVQALGWGEAGAARAPLGLPRSRKVGGAFLQHHSRTPQLSLPSLHLSQESRAGHRAVEETRGCGQRGRIQPQRQRGPARHEGTRCGTLPCTGASLEHPFPSKSHPAALRLLLDEARRQQPGSVSLCPPSRLNLGEGKGAFPDGMCRSPHSVSTTVTHAESQAAADGYDR